MSITKSIFEFSEQTAHRLTAEQKPYFLSDFRMTLDDHMIALLQRFPKAFRRSGQIAVQDLSVVVLKDVSELLRKHPAILFLPDERDPRGWGYACRYRADVPWYVAALPGRFTNTTFRHHPVMHLGYFKDLREWPPLDKFISHGLWGVQQNKRPAWTPLQNFIYGLSNYLHGDDLQNLQHALRSTNFFPVESDDDTTGQPLDWQLESSRHFSTINEIHEQARVTLPCMNLEQTASHWLQVFHKESEHTQVWVARSKHYPEPIKPGVACKPTLLGFLVGGTNPVTDEPQIHAIAVLHDERRRGIATSLVKRFFNQTGYSSVLVETEMYRPRPQYEGSGFLTALKATIRKKRPTMWQWDLSTKFMHSDTDPPDCNMNVK